MVLLGETLKKLRIDRRLNQGQLAEMMGLATSAISSYESCSRRPSYEILVKYARIFHVSTDYLLGIERQDYLDISDLSDKEKEAVMQVISVFRNIK
ncbi:MAG: helix-turn-helix transcriptional regulator [Butyrivibrio sp.]|nr:helix-turn-helix transcriptional regulator [Butyrivibrio sp.]